MSEENTQNLEGARSFEDRIFAKLDSIDARFDAVDARFDAVDARFNAVDARFDAVDAHFNAVDVRFASVDARFDSVEARFGARFDIVDGAFRDLNSRVERLEIRSYDTKPIWEHALKEILETKREVVEMRRELTKRLDRIEAIGLVNRADLRDVEERIDKLETKPTQ